MTIEKARRLVYPVRVMKMGRKLIVLGVGLVFAVLPAFSTVGASGVSGVKRRVNGLLTVYEPLKRVWVQTVYVEQV